MTARRCFGAAVSRHTWAGDLWGANRTPGLMARRQKSLRKEGVRILNLIQGYSPMTQRPNSLEHPDPLLESFIIIKAPRWD